MRRNTRHIALVDLRGCGSSAETNGGILEGSVSGSATGAATSDEAALIDLILSEMEEVAAAAAQLVAERQVDNALIH